jgi:hypothetical protein
MNKKAKKSEHEGIKPYKNNGGVALYLKRIA